MRLLEDTHAEAARIRAAAFEEVATFTRRLDTERTELMTEARAEAAKIVATAATPVVEPEPALVTAQPVVAKKSNGAAPRAREGERATDPRRPRSAGRHPTPPPTAPTARTRPPTGLPPAAVAVDDAKPTRKRRRFFSRSR